MDLSGKRVLVVGAGKSGIAAAHFLVNKGAYPCLTDSRSEGAFGNSLNKLKDKKITLHMGAYPGVSSGVYDLLVVSPGVPLNVPPVAKAMELGIPVIGELELAWWFTRAPVVAITGTNGKTTTTMLTGEVFKAAGYNTIVAGNIGIPLVDVVEDCEEEDVIVAEVSSFQLETSRSFSPRVAVVLNITPDHLDRHGSVNEYALVKSKIFTLQSLEHQVVLNYDDPITRAMSNTAPGGVIFFSRRHILEKGVFVHNGYIVSKMNNDRLVNLMSIKELMIPGRHNLENALAATACALAMGIEPHVIAKTLRSFAGVPHRLELVSEKNGVQYINDSKGTNPEASIKALEAYDKPLILIAGGRNKGSDFSLLAKKIKQKAKVLIVLGECAEELAEAACKAGCDLVLKVEDLPAAVKAAHKVAVPGDIVLLSPACASWDMFANYEERGDCFKEAVLKLGR